MDVLYEWRWQSIKKIWWYLDKIGNGIKKELDSESIYKEKVQETKIKFYSDEATDFYEEEFLK